MSTFTAIKIPTDFAGQPEVVEISDFRQIQDAVGGTFDAITVTGEPGHFSVFVHDEGLLIGLDINVPLITLIHRLSGVPYQLVGPGLVAGPVNGRGETTDAPQWLIDAVFEQHTRNRERLVTLLQRIHKGEFPEDDE